LNRSRKINKINKNQIYKNQIFIPNLDIYSFKYNKSKTDAVLAEEVGRRWDCGANNEEHMDHPCVISSPLPLGEVLHNPQ